MQKIQSDQKPVTVTKFQRTKSFNSIVFFAISPLTGSLHAASNLRFSIQRSLNGTIKMLVVPSRWTTIHQSVLMLHMFINAILQEGTVISVSFKHVSVCKWIQLNKQAQALFTIFNRKKIYNSNVTIQMISTLFVSLFMCIHKSCFICNLTSLE